METFLNMAGGGQAKNKNTRGGVGERMWDTFYNKVPIDKEHVAVQNLESEHKI